MDNLIDFNSSPVQFVKRKKVPSNPTFNLSSQYGLEKNDFGNLHDSGEHYKLLNDPFETQLTGNSEAKLATATSSLNDLLGRKNYNLKQKFEMIPNWKHDECNCKLKYYSEELGKLENTKNENLVCLCTFGNLGNNSSQAPNASDIEDKHIEELLIDFEEQPKTLEYFGNTLNICASDLDKNLSRSKLNKTDKKNGLLKLSLSNALIQSPASRRSSLENEIISEASILNEAAKLAKQLSQTHINSPNSSPNKRSDDSCEDLMQINPNWVDSMSESDISRDLELLKIPMLDKISDDLKNGEITSEKEHSSTHLNAEKFDITALKEKFKYRENEKFSKPTENVDELIFNLKNYVLHSKTELEKKHEAQNLLDHLSCLLKRESVSNKSEIIGIPETKTNSEEPKPPVSLVRQGTFNIDNENSIYKSKAKKGNTVSGSEPKKDKDMQSLPPEMNHMVEQITKILGQSENVNILQSNLQNSTTSIASNPTVIVVMASPNQKQFRRRSYSLTLPDKKNLRLLTSDSHALRSKEIASQPKDSNSFKTPNRNYLNRRNSISAVTPNNAVTHSMIRQSIYGNINSNTKQSIKNKSHSNAISTIGETKYISNIKSDVNLKRFRLKSNENVPVKGPVKATFQINSVKSDLKLLHSTPIKNCNIRRKSMFDTHAHSVSVSSRNFITKNPPIACSTPMLGSPTNSPINKKVNPQRFSITPNKKSQSTFLNASGNLSRNRRKSFSDSSKVTGKQKGVIQTSPGVKISQEASKVVTRLKIPSTPTRLAVIKKENKDPKK